MTTNTDTHGGGVEAVRQRVRAAVEVALAVCHREGYGVALSANAEDTFIEALMPIAALAVSPDAPAAAAGVEQLRFVFDRFPCPEGARFVEVEDENGRSLNAGEWRSRDDGLVELVLHRASPSQGV